MGTTPTYSWPYPESTDPVANGAQDIEDLALAVETTVSGLGGGKIVQVVRATDSTIRTTTSTSFVDANLSVTITPTSATSTILLLWTAYFTNGSGSPRYGFAAITDSSNVDIQSAESQAIGIDTNVTNYNALAFFGYDSPATTSATTYKARFRTANATNTVTLGNNGRTGQLIAMEVGA